MAAEARQQDGNLQDYHVDALVKIIPLDCIMLNYREVESSIS